MFPELTDQALQTLHRHNLEWQERWQIFVSHVPWPGTGILPYGEFEDWRWTVETYLPWREFRHSLQRLASAFLPFDEWLPYALHSRSVFLTDLGLPETPGFLTEFWDWLPESLAGRVTFQPAELLPLFCALADPPRFGTDSGRYSGQMAVFAEHLKIYPHDSHLHLLDLGCGIGLGTYELAESVRQAGLIPQIQGVTKEPLEVWMAARRRVPHDQKRQLNFPPRPDAAVNFSAGTAEKYRHPIPSDFIFCNGLVGGRFLCRESDYDALLDNCATNLRPQGEVFLANSFHDGCRQNCEVFRQVAIRKGWQTAGPWNNLILKP